MENQNMDDKEPLDLEKNISENNAENVDNADNNEDVKEEASAAKKRTL